MEKIEINEFTQLPSGENLNQQAWISPVENGVEYEVLTDSIIEYQDFLNLSLTLEVLSEFFDVNTAVLTNNNQICAAALGNSILNALEKLTECDPISITEGYVGFSKEVDVDSAKLLKGMQVRSVIAPKFTKEALKYLTETSEIMVIQVKSPLQELLGFNEKDIKLTPFGYLVQEPNNSKLTKSNFKPAGKTKPTQQLAEDAIFAWKISKYTKSPSAVIAKDLSTKAIVQGTSNQVCAVEGAMDLACENSKDAVLSLDGTISQEEVVNAAIQGRIGLIIESADGVNSDKISKLADKYGIAFIKTGIRNIRY